MKRHPQPAHERRPPGAEEELLTGRRLVYGLGCGAFELLAVALEMLSGQAANTPSAARYEAFVPLGWPAPVRVGWWLLVAAAAAGTRRLLHPTGGRGEVLRAGALALPFVVFAAGIGCGADWATWH